MMVMAMKIHSEQGASAVEFALVLPILLLLTFGIIEFGILLFDKAVITNASREGARLGIVYAQVGANQVQKNDGEVKKVVTDYANGLLINLGSTKQNLTPGDIVISPGTRASGDDLKVEVTFIYDFLIFPNLTELVGGSFNGTIPLKGTTVMRME